MVSEPHDWAVPAPLRALLWWPPLAFVLVLLEPTAAAGTIAAVGAVLAVLGVLATAAARAIGRRRTPHGTDAPTLSVAAAADPMALTVERQAA